MEKIEELKGNEEFMTKFEELVGDENFRAQLKGVKERDKIRQLFTENGLVLPEEVLDASEKEVKRLEETGELDEKALEFVAGGWSWSAFMKGFVTGSLIGGFGGPYGAIAGGIIGGIVCGMIG